MKGMMTRLLLALTVAVASVSSAYAFNLFGLFSSDQSDNSMENLLSQTPADTALFIGWHNTTEGLDIMDSWALANQSDITELQTLLADMGSDDSPMLRLTEVLLADYLATATSGYSELLTHYGLPAEGAGALYLHGAMPVARFALEDPEAFNAVLNQAILESGAAPILKQIEGVEVRTWQLTPEGDAESVDLAIAIDQGVATITLFNHTDTNALQAERLGLVDISDSLAEQGDWDALGEQYAYDETFRGYIDLDGVAATLLTGTKSRLRRDLEALMPDEIERMDTYLAESQCGPEGYALARQVPRFAFGSENISATPDTLSQQIGMILELTNTDLTSQLSRLPGSLPAYATDGSDKLLAFALGLDVNALAPVATALWSQLTGAEYKCQALADAVAPLRQNNPAMLGMATAMAQGVKGLGAAVYGIEADDNSPYGLVGSALVTLSADNPSVLAGLISSSIPGMAGVTIPEDGTAVQVPLPMVPQPVFAAIKGKHLVVYTGDTAKAPADAMASEPLNTRGSTAIAFNYERFGEAALVAMESPMVASNAQGMAMATGSCVEAYAGILQAAALPLEGSYRDTYTDRGWEAKFDVTLGKMTTDFSVPTGTYQSETLDVDCTWYDSGVETINANGTGQFTEMDETGQCELYQANYTWTQDGNMMEQTTTELRSRNTCEADWEEQPEETFNCALLGNHNGFHYCQYGTGMDAYLVRYVQ
ncbi:hypothetical protein [Saccharospirillum sp.]|uniref:hypothetical protein n=1 Tax=Saccharospirillum sp. TaxID=2033801 RepID=UPI0034A07649